MTQTLDPEIGYVLKGYPRLSETFIINEIHLLETMGLRLHIFSAKESDEPKSHAIVDQIRANVTYLPEATSVEDGPFSLWLATNLPRFARSHLRLLMRRPKAYLQTLVHVLLGLSLQFPFGKWPLFKKSVIKDFLRAGYIAQQVVEAGRIHHLHGHFCHGATTITMLASYLTGVPFSFTAHAKDIYLPRFNPHGLLQTKIEKARFVVTCTDANRTYLEQLCPQGSSIYTIYHGLNTEFFAPIAGAAPQEGPPTILAVGRFVKKKGFPYLVRACRILKERGFAFQCRIIGQAGEDSAQVQALLQELGMADTVRIEGGMTQEELRQAYAQASIFAMPCQIVDNGDRDGIPNVLAEAMAMGLPVVATNISGIPELVEHGVDGLLVPQKDVTALADALARCLQEPALCRRLGQQARAKICRVFDSQQTTFALRDLFVACLEKRAAPEEPRVPTAARRRLPQATSATGAVARKAISPEVE